MLDAARCLQGARMEDVSRDFRERANLRDALLKLNRGNQVDKESRKSKVIAAALAREAAAGAVARGDWEEWRKSTAGMDCEEEIDQDVPAPGGPNQGSTTSESCPPPSIEPCPSVPVPAGVCAGASNVGALPVHPREQQRLAQGYHEAIHDLLRRLEVWSAEGGQLEAALAHKAQRFHTLLQRFISVMHIGTDARVHGVPGVLRLEGDSLLTWTPNTPTESSVCPVRVSVGAIGLLTCHADTHTLSVLGSGGQGEVLGVELEGEAAMATWAIGLASCRSALCRAGGGVGEQWSFLLWQCARLLLLDMAAQHGFYHGLCGLWHVLGLVEAHHHVPVGAAFPIALPPTPPPKRDTTHPLP